MSAAARAGDPVVPRAALRAAALLILLTLLLAAAARLTGRGRVADAPTTPPAAALSLRFADLPDGSVDVVDAARGASVARLDPGSHNFARGMLRGLARERRRRGLGPEAPFHLARYADGRLLLTDPATGARVDLRAFGPTNAALFATLLTPAR